MSKINCECGANIKLSSLQQHVTTQKHLNGSGLISDVFNKVKSVLSIRNGYNNMAQKTLKTYGNMRIFKMFIYRKPVVPLIENFLNIISLGAYEQSKQQMSYDKMFHLGCFIMVGNELGQFYNIIVEKNEVIHVEKANFNLNGEKDIMQIVLNPNVRISLIQLLNNCQNKMLNNYFLYDPFKNNCQMFIRALLQSNNVYSEKLNAFGFQPIDLLIKNLPQATQTIAKAVTNLGGIWNKITGGALPMEQKQKAIEAEKAYKDKRTKQQNDPKNDAYYMNMENKQKIAKDNSEYLNMTELQKARYMRGLKQRQQDYTDYTNDRLEREQAEFDRIEAQKARNADPWSGLTDIVESAVSYIPVVGKYVSEPIKMLRNKLEGLGLQKNNKRK